MTQYNETLISIPHNQKTISAVVTVPTGRPSGAPPRFGIILTHGASGNSERGKLPLLCRYLAVEGGFIAVRFTFISPRLEHRVVAMRKVLAHVFGPNGDRLHEVEGCILSGHSMGSRAAVMLATEIMNGKVPKGKTKDVEADIEAELIPPSFVRGVLAMSYPLHAPGQKNDLRDQILYDLPSVIPLMFVSGTEDPLCDHQIMETVRGNMTAHTEMVKLVRGDHSLYVDKWKSDFKERWNSEMCELVNEWCKRVIGGAISEERRSDMGSDDTEEKKHENEKVEKSTAMARKRKRSTKTTVKKAAAKRKKVMSLTTIVELIKGEDNVFKVLKLIK
ncbi:hypothetical protein BC936DRAFT_144934 [Jimgerdemannia flammicorona]|uniref:KANL3/Tex30 alpha/beta hydrolase-like domain-containing protein n=1 Tax=Jimgerdemannia flammicorona TaxID=994334 RepID=A0A433DM18_9FUNG|nr:hypothetical protein BC936DRAFT_144934 [Jimgerdemannia flammicorona]